MPTKRASERKLRRDLDTDRVRLAAMENLEWHHKVPESAEGMLYDALRRVISLAEEALKRPKPPKKG